MRPFARCALIATLLALVGASFGRAADIPPLTERELATFLAVEEALIADASRATEFCSVDFSSGAADPAGATDSDGAQIGRQLDAHAYFGPILRRHSISGQRFAQITAQIVANALGLALVDSLDDSAREKQEPATNRATFLEKSADARIVSAHLEEINAALTQAGELCGGGRDEGDESDESDGG